MDGESNDGEYAGSKSKDLDAALAWLKAVLHKSKPRKPTVKHRCSACKQIGHNAATCPPAAPPPLSDDEAMCSLLDRGYAVALVIEQQTGDALARATRAGAGAHAYARALGVLHERSAARVSADDIARTRQLRALMDDAVRAFHAAEESIAVRLGYPPRS